MIRAGRLSGGCGVFGHFQVALFALVCVLAGLADTSAETPPPDYLVQSWGSEQGLPSASVSAIVRTPDGFIWVGTPNGLARFDGQRFQESRSTAMRPLHGVAIIALVGDDHGGLWVATDPPGLFHVRHDRAEPVPLGSTPTGFRINSMAVDTDGTLLLATFTRGLLRQSGNNWLTNDDPAMNQHAMFLARDRDGGLWASTVFSAHLSHCRAGKWVAAAEFERLGPMTVEGLAPARQGGVWVAAKTVQPKLGRSRRVFHVGSDLTVNELPRYHWDLDSTRWDATAIGEDARGDVWVGTVGAGVFSLSPSGSWTPLRAEGPLADLIVRTLEPDGEGSMWVAFDAGGLTQVRRRPVTVLKLPEPSRQNIVLCACATRDGSLWAATDGAGVFRYRDGKFTAFGAADGLASLHVGVLLEDHTGTLWAGTFDGVYRFNGTRFELVSGPPPLETPTVVSMLEDHAGALWVSTPRGIIRFKDGQTHAYLAADGVPMTYVMALAEDRDGNIWAAVPQDGLYRLERGRFVCFAPGQWPEEKSLRSLYADADGALWIAAYGVGLARLKDGKFRHWNLTDGLPDVGIHGVFGDKKGNLWFASNGGAFSCSKAELEAYVPGKSPPVLCQRVSVEEGMVSRYCSGFGQPIVAQMTNGGFCFPNRQTLAMFDPRDLPSGENLRPVRVDEVLADDDRLEPAADNAVHASSRSRRYEFHYTSPNLLGGGQLRFRYRLAGLEEKWVNSGSQRAAYYTQLAPGHYEFQVAVGGPDGTWREATGGQRLEVTPQWWQHRWLQAGTGFLGLGLIAWTGGAASRARGKRRVRQLELRAEVERERRRIAQDLHDDLGSGLTELMLLAENVSRHSDSPVDVRHRATHIAHRAQTLAATTDEIVWTLNPVNDSLRNLVGYLSDFAQSYLHHTSARCRLDIGELDDLPVTAATRHNLLMAFKEALNNAVKHSGATEIWVRIRSQPARLQIVVEDNGRGFDPAKIAAGGNGLSNFRERLAVAGGVAEIDSAMGRGTRILFILPFPRV